MENTESEDDEDVPIAYSHNDDGEEEDEDDEEPSDDDFSAPNPPLRGRGRGSGRGAGGRGAGGRGRGARANSAAWGRRSLTFHMPAFTAPTGPRPVPAALKDSHDVDLFLVDATLFAGRALGGGAGADRVDYNTEKRRRTAADILPAIRLHPGAHLVVQTGHARICAWCYKSAKKQNKTVYMCKTCDLPLHPDCFEIFHDPHTEL